MPLWLLFGGVLFFIFCKHKWHCFFSAHSSSIKRCSLTLRLSRSQEDAPRRQQHLVGQPGNCSLILEALGIILCLRKRHWSNRNRTSKGVSKGSLKEMSTREKGLKPSSPFTLNTFYSHTSHNTNECMVTLFNIKSHTNAHIHIYTECMIKLG